MDFLPLGLKLAGHTVVVVGGGDMLRVFFVGAVFGSGQPLLRGAARGPRRAPGRAPAGRSWPR